MVAAYLAEHADALSVATLVRRVATISKAHEAKGLPNPCRSEIVRATMRGIKRTRGGPKRKRLRAGFVTSAVQAGVSTLKVRSQTGHASDAMLARYVRDGELFVDNAAGVLL